MATHKFRSKPPKCNHTVYKNFIFIIFFLWVVVNVFVWLFS